MIKIPNFGEFEIKYILIDYNGTIADGGKLLDVKERLRKIDYEIIIITGDTYGDVRKQLENYPVRCELAYTADEKLTFINSLNPKNCIAIGNGSIDYKMLKAAAVGISVLGSEGVSSKAILNADILVKSFDHALDLIEYPNKLIATLKE